MSRWISFKRPIFAIAILSACSIGEWASSAAPLAAADTAAASESRPLQLHTRTRVESTVGSGQFHVVTEAVTWDPHKTAIIVCDMWNQHWCQGATRRVAEMAPRMNDVLNAARRQGVLIIHCPSNTMKFYAETPQRQRAQKAAHVATKIPLLDSCALNKKREGALPIDDSDGGCDCNPPCKHGSPWTRQIATLQIEPPDAITDSAEAFYLMKERGIENAIVMGVHTNMCVLGRPFSLRQLAYQGINVVLMRDMTDTMYNSRSVPFVSHFTGTDLVVEHIEKHWCPTITSVDFLGGHEFRFSEDHRPTVLIVMAEPEYDTDHTLPEFAAKELGKEFRVDLVFGSETDQSDLPGIGVLRDADVLLVSVRRRPLKPDQMKLIRDFVASGKPVVGIRTACHAFSLRSKKPKKPLQTWETWDPDVFGGHYVGHHGKGSRTVIRVDSAASSDPILTGVDVAALVGNGSLYRVNPLAPGTKAILIGKIPNQPAEPVAWKYERSGGGKSFFTSLGHRDDFKNPAFRRLLANGIRWAADR